MLLFISWDVTKTNLTFLCECSHWPLLGARGVDNPRLSFNSDKVARPSLTSSMPQKSNVQRPVNTLFWPPPSFPDQGQP